MTIDLFRGSFQRTYTNASQVAVGRKFVMRAFRPQGGGAGDKEHTRTRRSDVGPHGALQEDETEEDERVQRRSASPPFQDIIPGGAGTEQDHFPLKLHKLLEQLEAEGKQHIIGWNPDGKSFSVFKPKEFASSIMTRHFRRQSKYKSFQRQLNLYAFKRENIGKIKGVYSHAMFVRENRELCKSMKRERGPTGASLPASGDGASSLKAPPPFIRKRTAADRTNDGFDLRKESNRTYGATPLDEGDFDRGTGRRHHLYSSAPLFKDASQQYDQRKNAPISSFGTLPPMAAGSTSSNTTAHTTRGASNLFLSEQTPVASLLPQFDLRGNEGASSGTDPSQQQRGLFDAGRVDPSHPHSSFFTTSANNEAGKRWPPSSSHDNRSGPVPQSGQAKRAAERPEETGQLWQHDRAAGRMTSDPPSITSSRRLHREFEGEEAWGDGGDSGDDSASMGTIDGLDNL